MAKEFDPYYFFLGIPPKDQPPDYYRLLGVDQLESNVEIISMGADRQMSHLQRHESGDHMDEVAKLLSEVSRARLCLLNPAKKSIYDATLSKQLEPVEEKLEPLEEVIEATVLPEPKSPQGDDLFGELPATQGSTLRSVPPPRWTAENQPVRPPKRPPQQTSQPVRTGTSNKATISLVLGLLSFCFTLLTGIPAVVFGVMAMSEIRRNPKLGGQGIAIAGMILGGTGILVNVVVSFFLLIPAVQSAREAATRTRSSNNMKQIGLGFHNHHDVYKSLPSAGSENSSTPGSTSLNQPSEQQLSWRVQILPFIEQSSLYDEFERSEPWDSSQNRALVSRMPETYQSPSFRSDDHKTVYLGVVGSEVGLGNDTAFNYESRPVRMRDMTDGTSNMVMMVEADAGEAAIWSRPKDWQFDPANPRRGLGELRNGRFLALFADGSIHTIDLNKVDDDMLRAIFCRDDGRNVDLPSSR
jgi:hypothetical protein